MFYHRLTRIVKDRIEALDTELLVRFAALATISEAAWAISRNILLAVLHGGRP